MPPWARELLAWLKENAAWLISAWAVWIAVRGRRFDARRSYSEFVLKQRIEAATRMMQAAITHFGLLSQMADTQRRIDSGTLLPQVRDKMLEDLSALIPVARASMASLDEANAAALPFFTRQLLDAANDLATLHKRAYAKGGGTIDVDPAEVQKAMGRIHDVVQAELDIAGVIKYQRRLFRR